MAVFLSSLTNPVIVSWYIYSQAAEGKVHTGSAGKGSL
jgi:hypothetical protein